MNSLYIRILKPIFDVLFALLSIILLSPIIIGLFFLLLIANKSNPIFSQERVSKDCKIFRLYKFRTMNNKKDSAGNLLPDKDRITKIGKIVRTLSLDELPQLFNILMGKMSFIGPRPLLKDYLPLYDENQQRRHLVKPGMSGWAQVNGRNSISWSKKFDLDVWYVDNISFFLDTKIIIKTVQNVIERKDIDNSSGKTMPAFNGKN